MAQIFALPFESGYFRPHHKYNGQLQLNRLPKYPGKKCYNFQRAGDRKIAFYSKDLIVELKKKKILVNNNKNTTQHKSSVM